MDAEALEAADIMARYCKGDAAAFGRLYALVAPRILGYLTGLMGEKAAAEDTLQVTFLKIHEARSSYVLGANPIPWIYTIAHRTCLDELRRRKRSRVRLTSDGAVQEMAAHISGVRVEDRDEARGEARDGVRDEQPGGGDGHTVASAMAALEKLPENQRLALILTKVHGRTIAEAAMITGTTTGAIKQRAHRAYVTLRRTLGIKDHGAAGKEMA